MDKLEPEKPIAGLPDARKRRHAFGTPSVDEFLATISRHREQFSTRKPARAKRVVPD